MKVELARAQKLLDQRYPDPDEAIKLLHPLLRRESKHWLVYYFLGIAQMQKSNFEKAIGYFEKSIGEHDQNSQTYLLVARCYYQLEDFENAERFGKAAVQLNQELLDAWMFMGKLYWDQALLNKAIQCYTIANKLDPKNYLIAYNIGQIYADQGDYKKALELYDITLQMEPKLIDAGIKKAQIYQSIGEHERAEEAIQKVLEIDSENLLALSVLSLLYRAMGRYSEAIELNERLLDRYPNDGNVRVNYALCLVETGQYDEAEKNYRRALKDAPETQQSLSNYLMGIHYNPKRTKEEIFEAHSLWDQYYAPEERPVRPVPANKDKDKKLRVGFISGGFKKHPVGWMITSALEELLEDEIATYIYTTDTYHDSLTKRIREASAKWTSVVGYSDEVVAQIIKDDEIDILVELSGHSSGNRLKTVALEPAPITIKWVGGLFNTSGLQSMDYLLTDAKESPEGEEPFYTEKLVRMPDDYVCYTLPNYDIEVAEAPVTQNGYITFGCFNNPTKINTELLSKWAEILKQVPASRLFLKSKQYDTELVRERITQHLAERDIEEDRVIFEGYSLHNELLECYNKIDIALDPWPYSGGLTTIEALWMGVPVITNSGPTFAGRHSTSHLTNAGFPEWVTDNWEDYIQKAVSLAGDVDQLSKLRAELRGRLLSSPVCDAQRFARNLADAFRKMWLQRVQGYEKHLSEGEWQDHIWVSQKKKESETHPESLQNGKQNKALKKGIYVNKSLVKFKDTPSEVVEAIVNTQGLKYEEPLTLAIPESELFRLRNIFEDHEYGLPSVFKLNKNSVVVDIGGNVGSFSLYARQWNPDCQIYSFEPNPQVFPLLAHNTKDLENISINQVALSDKNGEINLFQHPRNTGQSSTTFHMKGGHEVAVKMQKSGEALAEKGINKIDVLKIDTEGAEVSILKGMKDLLINTGFIMLEYHSEADRREIDAILSGFSVYASGVSAPCEVGTIKYINNRILNK
ncbi:FkbM family methyltransferase [Gracilimonas sp.]|uniref:FkbM family methyltransferase n=1 Tax=Gracilimonas sp. TaxID=1974203 RepID=UPI0032EED82A